MYGSDGCSKCTVARLPELERSLPRYHLPFGARNLEGLQISRYSNAQSGLKGICQSANLTCIVAAKLALRCQADLAEWCC